MVIHFSIDDIWRTFYELFSNTPDCIFDVPFFSYLKRCHEKYGVCFSLYVVAKSESHSIADYDSKYRDQFLSQSNWLKFALHCVELLPDKNNAFVDYAIWYKKLCNIVGSETVTNTIRLHGFHCPDQLIETLHGIGVTTLLCSDDERCSYKLTVAEDKFLKLDNHFDKDGICYLRTAFRLEKEPKILYRLQHLTDVPKVPVFTHEYFFYGKRKAIGTFMMNRFLKCTKKNDFQFCID